MFRKSALQDTAKIKPEMLSTRMLTGKLIWLIPTIHSLVNKDCNAYIQRKSLKTVNTNVLSCISVKLRVRIA